MPRPRIRDRQAILEAKLREPWCVICRAEPTASAHHVLPRSGGAHPSGDDVPANLVGVCGDGTTGCHGRLESRDPVARSFLGAYIEAERPDIIAYLGERLQSEEIATDWLHRHLYVRPRR